VPFGVRNAQEVGQARADPRMKVAGFVGVTAAPRDALAGRERARRATEPARENKMMEYLAWALETKLERAGMDDALRTLAPLRTSAK
jgi:hypothetical protein